MGQRYSIHDFLNIRSAGGPSFTFDDQTVIFLSNQSGTRQIYRMPAKGGQPEQLTSFEDAVDLALASPVRNELIFGLSHGGNERMQLYKMDLDSKKYEALTAKPEVKYSFGGWSRDGRLIAYGSNERTGEDFDIYVMNLETREARMVFQEGGWAHGAGFSPDGRFLMVERMYSAIDQDLYVVDLPSGEVIHATPHEGPMRNSFGGWLSDPDNFLLLTDRGRDLEAVACYSLSSRSMEYVLTSEYEIDGLSVSRDGRYAAITENQEGYSEPAIYTTDSWQIACPLKWPRGVVGALAWSYNHSSLAISLQTPGMPRDVFVQNIGGELRQLTRSENPIDSGVFVLPEVVRYSSFDGLSVPAFIYLPKEIPPEGVPAVIDIHGGPEGQFRPDFDPLVQYFVYRGYAVVAPNVRGSSGYGRNYLSLDDRQKRMDSVKDLAALHDLLKEHPAVDAERLALFGGSYGGYMVLAGLAFYPKLWKAGVDIVGISDLVTFLQNTSPYRRKVREVEYGYLSTDRDFLASVSPINFLERITAPLFIIHGANDPRVPLSEAEEIYKRLKDLQRPVELMVYTDEGHGLAKLKNRLDAYPKAADFLDRTL